MSVYFHRSEEKVEITLPAADVEAEFFLISKSKLDTGVEFDTRKRQISQVRTTAKIRH